MVGGQMLSNWYRRIARRRRQRAASSNIVASNNSSSVQESENTNNSALTTTQMDNLASNEALEGAMALSSTDSDISMESLTSITAEDTTTANEEGAAGVDIVTNQINLQPIQEDDQQDVSNNVINSLNPNNPSLVSNIETVQTIDPALTVQTVASTLNPSLTVQYTMNSQPLFNVLNSNNTLQSTGIVESNIQIIEEPNTLSEAVNTESLNLQNIVQQSNLESAIFTSQVAHNIGSIAGNFGKSFVPCLPNHEVEAMGSVFREVFICPICQSEYCIDTGDPRTLKCGHSLCSSCLERLYDGSAVECAECRNEFSYENITEIPISFTIKQIIAKYKEKKNELENPRTINENLIIQPNEVIENDNNELVTSLGNCKDHSLPLHFGCVTCEEWLCGTCVCLYHSGKKSKECKVYQISEALQRVRHNMMDLFVTQKVDVQLKKVLECNLKQAADKLINNAEELVAITQNYISAAKVEQKIHSDQEDQYVKLDQHINHHLSKINDAKSTTEVKNSIDQYFESRKELKETKPDNCLFSIWSRFIRDATQTMEVQTGVVVPRKMKDGTEEMLTVKSIENEVLLEFGNDSSYLRLEAAFFDLQKHIYHAFITIRKPGDIVDYGKITFLLHNNPLAEAFLKKCSSVSNSFKGTRLFVPGRSSGSMCFGEMTLNSRREMLKIENKSQYLKPVTQGSIGIFNSFEITEEIDVNNMLIYINMWDEEASRSNVHFISNSDSTPKLKLCFGMVYEGFEDLEGFMDDPNETLTINRSGVKVSLIDDSDAFSE